ncbi:15369_t:CDS:2, partial [Entrophospora sp. SA101]
MHKRHADNLAIKNEIARMQKESEWRSEVRSQGLCYRQASVKSLQSEYTEATETLWVEFTTLFNEIRKKEK